MSSYTEYDSFTTEGGTKYVARYKKGNSIIEKFDPSGRRSVISSQKGGSKSGARNAVAATFDSFKSGLEKAQAGEDLSYSQEDVTAGGGGGLFGGRDQYSTITLSDGTVLQSAAGKTKDEVATVKRLADEIGAAYVEQEEEVEEEEEEEEIDDETRLEGADEVAEKDIIEETQIDLGDTEEAEAAEEALAEVGQAGAAAFGGSKVGDVTQGTESFTDEEELEEQVQVTQEEIDTALEEENDIVDDVVATSGTSILTSVPAAAQTISSGTALGGQQEQAAAISVGPAEDEAVEMYTRGRRATIATRPGGLLTPTEEMDDPRFRRRRSLLAG